MYVCMYVYIYIYIYYDLLRSDALREACQDSSQGGAVETGCSGLHYIIGCFII